MPVLYIFSVALLFTSAMIWLYGTLRYRGLTVGESVCSVVLLTVGAIVITVWFYLVFLFAGLA